MNKSIEKRLEKIESNINQEREFLENYDTTETDEKIATSRLEGLHEEKAQLINKSEN